MSPKKENMLRAGELAKRAGVSLPTIKHYVNEGLIPKPLKTGKTMAYYDESCVERIRLIKKLQKEKFLPLDVIKRALDSGEAYEEEIELGQAILKSNKLSTDVRPVGRARIERHTGYPIEKIDLLEQKGVILPTLRDGGKFYDHIDLQIIEIMKRREDMGVPFDNSLETVMLYRDAIAQAVRKDIGLFARHYLGDIPTRQAVKFLTEVDEPLDSFMLLFRQKMLRSQAETAIEQMNEFSQSLHLLSFLPLQGAELPKEPPGEPMQKMIYHFCRGDYDAAVESSDELAQNKGRSPRAAVQVIASFLKGDSDEALSLVERHIPKPTARALNNAAAALAYMSAVSKAKGFSTPAVYAKKALAHLQRIETSRESNALVRLFSLYVCGSILTMLPDMFDTCGRGLKILERVEKSLRSANIRGRHSDWLTDTLEYEVLPALEIRINRLLAEGYLNTDRQAAAEKRLSRLLEIASADDEHAQWARLKKLQIGAESKQG